MRVLVATMGGCGTNERIPGEENGVVLVGEGVIQDGNDECEDNEEGGFDHYEPQSPGTPASSPCPASPATSTTSTTPTSSRSSTLSDCYPQRSIFPSATYITKSISDPATAAMQLQTPFSTPLTAGSPMAPTCPPKPKSTILDLPPELLQQVFTYALDGDWMYDYLEEDDGNSVTWPTGGENRVIVIPEEHISHFRVMRVEIQLSQVCRWWREVMRDHLVRKTLTTLSLTLRWALTTCVLNIGPLEARQFA